MKTGDVVYILWKKRKMKHATSSRETQYIRADEFVYATRDWARQSADLEDSIKWLGGSKYGRGVNYDYRITEHGIVGEAQ